MRVKEIMSKTVQTCSADSTLESVALSMWDNDCGCIPVVNETGLPTAVITDRDIAIGSALQHKPLWEISVQDIVSGHPLFCCKSNDEISTAMQLMREHGVRRLPVLHSNGRLAGIISMGDILAFAKDEQNAALSLAHTESMLKAVTGHHTELQVA